MHVGAYVMPFPNQEWVSSCTTTSTSVRSPARRAKHNNQELMGYLRNQHSLGVKKERQAFSFRGPSTKVGKIIKVTHHAPIGEGGRKD
jgi:hypothetical protein